MRCSSRPWRAWKIGTGRALARLVAIAFVLIGVMSAAQAQCAAYADTHADTHATDAQPTPTMINSMVSSGAAVTNLGSNFLERLGNQSSNGFNRLQRTNPGGGGASESTEAPRYRTWFEGYGNLDEERRGRRFRRRQPQDLGRRGRDRRAGGAGHQYRLLRRPEPLRRSTFRWRCNRRRST